MNTDNNVTAVKPTLEEIEEQREEVMEHQHLFWSELTRLEQMIAEHIGVEFVELESTDDLGDTTAELLIEKVKEGEAAQ